MSKARTVANMSITPAAVSDQANTSTGAFDTPGGTQSQRPATPSTGMIRYNSDTGYMETYTVSGWAAIATPPSIATVSPTSFNGEQGTAFTINGSFFDAGATVKFVTAQGAEYSAASVSFVNSGQVTATTPQDFTVAQEPLSVRLVNGSGLSAFVSDVVDCGGTPTWNTASGTIVTTGLTGTLSTSVSATDPDAGATVTYSVTSGALPSGATLNSSTGAITGTVTVPDSSTTYTFTVTASDNAGNSSARSFSIVVTGFNDADTLFYAPLISNSTDVRNNVAPSSAAGTISTVGGYAALYLANQALIYGSSGISALNGDNTWTVEYWLYKTGGNGLGTEIEMGGSGMYYSTGVLARWDVATSGAASSQTYFANGGPYAVGNRTIGQWVHVAMVGDGGTLRHYENGVQKGAVTIATAFTVAPAGMYVGSSQHTNLQTSVMYIRKLRVSNTVRYPSGTTFTPSNVYPI